jgi:hypothetical protein
MYSWMVFLHVLSAFAFVMAHGISVGVLFKVKQETNAERIAALVELSVSYFGGMYISLLVMLVTGIALGFMGGLWGQGWLWTSLVLLIIEMGAMPAMATRPFTELRKALGLPYFERMKPQPALPRASAEEITKRLAVINPIPVAVIGFGGLAIIIWLMMFKPF